MVAVLLDRASLLSPETRAILLGATSSDGHTPRWRNASGSAKALKLRLHRGSRSRALLEEFSDTALAYGLAPSAKETWEETRLVYWLRSAQARPVVSNVAMDQASSACAVQAALPLAA